MSIPFIFLESRIVRKCGIERIILTGIAAVMDTAGSHADNHRPPIPSSIPSVPHFMFRTLVFAATLLATHVLVGSGAHGHDITSGDIKISHPWARASLAAKVRNGATYMTVHNLGTRSDRLLGVTTHIADRAELHAHEMKGNVMKMRPLDAIDVPAGGMIELKPGGLHIMLFGLKTPLRKGLSFPMRLKFEAAGEVDLLVVIEAGTSSGSREGHRKHMTK